MEKILPLELGSLLEELVEELVGRSLEQVAEQVDSDDINKQKRSSGSLTKFNQCKSIWARFKFRLSGGSQTYLGNTEVVRVVKFFGQTHQSGQAPLPVH